MFTYFWFGFDLIAQVKIFYARARSATDSFPLFVYATWFTVEWYGEGKATLGGGGGGLYEATWFQ